MNFLKYTQTSENPAEGVTVTLDQYIPLHQWHFHVVFVQHYRKEKDGEVEERKNMWFESANTVEVIRNEKKKEKTTNSGKILDTAYENLVVKNPYVIPVEDTATVDIFENWIKDFVINPVSVL